MEEPSQQLAILVVEDEPIIAIDLAQALTERGAKVLGPIASLSEPIDDWLQSPELGAAVVNFKLEDGNSLPILVKLKADGVPVILTTGYSRDMVPRPLDGLAYFAKPYVTADVADAAIGIARLKLSDQRKTALPRR